MLPCRPGQVNFASVAGLPRDKSWRCRSAGYQHPDGHDKKSGAANNLRLSTGYEGLDCDHLPARLSPAIIPGDSFCGNLNACLLSLRLLACVPPAVCLLFLSRELGISCCGVKDKVKCLYSTRT